MKTLFVIFAGMMLLGCGPPPPVPKATHVKQVQEAISRGGGETNILAESLTLFARLSTQTGYVFGYWNDNPWCDGLTGITKLGDVFHYNPSSPRWIQVRIYNSHFDTYSIYLLNPDLPEPAGFERIAGNIGFIKQ